MFELIGIAGGEENNRPLTKEDLSNPNTQLNCIRLALPAESDFEYVCHLRDKKGRRYDEPVVAQILTPTWTRKLKHQVIHGPRKQEVLDFIAQRL